MSIDLNKLATVAANEDNPKWEQMIKRDKELYQANVDLRNEFERDYTRVLYSNAYKRLKNKTQVFFSPTNDHICTRIEHVNHVESISTMLAKSFGLNTELTKTIAIAHDLGHSPFGHRGEQVLNDILVRDTGLTFWHERNGMEIVDKIVLLEDNEKNMRNLDLTYAVKDGIISHCGEIDENSLKPREEAINLYDYNYPNEYKPYTWEGCSVKIADKIAYLGRDIQDAVRLGILDEHLKELHEVMGVDEDKVINNTVIINYLIYDLCENTSLEEGFKFSDDAFNFINNLKEFNYKYIYNDERLKPSNAYFELVINTIYETLKRYYGEKEHIKKMYPEIIKDFEDWLKLYWNKERPDTCKNKVVFNTSDEKEFCQAIIYYISGMTDNYAISTYNKIIRF